jgi:hypothetical protein
MRAKAGDGIRPLSAAAAVRLSDHFEVVAVRIVKIDAASAIVMVDLARSAGGAFQEKFSTGRLRTLQRPVITRDIVVWKKEPLFPRLVAELASKNAVLFEPGDEGNGKPLVVRREFLQPLDLGSHCTA